MRRMLVILMLVAIVPVRAQWDTASAIREPLLSPAIGTTLIASGSLFTYNPYLKTQAVALRDNVQSDGHIRQPFDDYLQYLPAVAPVALNLCGIKGRHSFWRLALLEGGSYLLGATVLNVAKYGLAIQRPDESTFNSFPSGHTFTAFTGAEILRREYGENYPWIAVMGYTTAALVGAMRIYNNRHWAGDVLAGAGLGILCTSITYWILD